MISSCFLLIFFIAHSAPAEEADLVLDGVDHVGDYGEDDEKDDYDDCDDDVLLNHLGDWSGESGVRVRREEMLGE